VSEGDTIHRLARRINAALAGRRVEHADTPSPRSPIHGRAAQLEGRTLVEAEARGKHLLVRFDGGTVLHSHLGINGRWLIADDRLAGTGCWLRLACGPANAAQRGGRLLRLTSVSRARNVPQLLRLGPDPLRPDFDLGAAAARLRGLGAGRRIGDALLDQEIVAGIGNAIRAEALFRARISPWRRVEELGVEELTTVLGEGRRVMSITLDTGRRPRSVYRERGCPECGGPIASRGQGDDNRIAYWCPRCQA